MNDPLIHLFQLAGLTLLITILWALTLGVAYWDIQRRRQAGQTVNGLAWMAAVALLPFVGLLAYFAARLLAHPGAAGQAGARRETRLKAQPMASRPPTQSRRQAAAARRELPTIHGSEYQKETRPGRAGAAPAEPEPAISYRVSVIRGPDLGMDFRLERLPAQIGRDLGSTIRLELDVTVSRAHAVIYQARDRTLRIKDLKSTHGTRVNGRRVRDQLLKPGDRIQVGMTSLILQDVKE